jgi:23S rRNA (guanosine2251-2'-O)-methyltransferase
METTLSTLSSEDSNVVYGLSPVLLSIQAERRSLERLYIRSGKHSPALRRVAHEARQREIPIEEVSPQRLGNLAQDRHHQGVVLRCGPLPHPAIETLADQLVKGPRSLLVALDQIQDPQNTGAIIRTAAFLGADAIITLRHHSAPLNSTVCKASAGAMEIMPIAIASNLAEALLSLRGKGYTIVGSTLTPESRDLCSVTPDPHTVLVMGNEAEGIRGLTQKRCDVLVKIPGSDRLDSLNVNAAAAILIHHFLNP